MNYEWKREKSRDVLKIKNEYIDTFYEYLSFDHELKTPGEQKTSIDLRIKISNLVGWQAQSQKKIWKQSQFPWIELENKQVLIS